MSSYLRLGCFALLLSLAGCSQKQHGVQAHLDDHYPDKLSEWQFFTGKARELKPNEGVLSYEVNTSLFSNHAEKHRTVWMPKGVTGTYKSDAVFDLPVGTILTKTFSFGARRIETRLFIHKKNGWQGVTYVWNTDQIDATLDVTPAPVPVEWQGHQFDYEIPNVNQCKVCHEGPLDNGPLGITAKNLNRGGQLTKWVSAGYLQGVPANPPAAGTSLEARARDYLDVNCGTCHVVGGRGMKSGVILTANEHNPKNLGVCVKEVIVPGKPDQSKLVERMRSLDPKVMMPDLGHSIIDVDGIELIRQWIASMSTCQGLRT